MSRIYEDRGAARRLDIYMIILGLVFLAGCRELWEALAVDPADFSGLAFGAVFVGGAVYGVYQTFNDGRDLVTAFDVDFDTGNARVTMWQPFRRPVMEAPLSEFANWRFWVKVTGALRRYQLFAELRGYPRKLVFELNPSKPLDGLRRIAPAAIADFENSPGSKKAGPG